MRLMVRNPPMMRASRRSPSRAPVRHGDAARRALRCSQALSWCRAALWYGDDHSP